MRDVWSTKERRGRRRREGGKKGELRGEFRANESLVLSRMAGKEEEEGGMRGKEGGAMDRAEKEGRIARTENMDRGGRKRGMSCVGIEKGGSKG